MMAPLVLRAFALTGLLPRVGGLVICAALICSGCADVADERSLSAALTIATGILFAAIPFYLHRQFLKPHSSRSTTEQ